MYGLIQKIHCREYSKALKTFRKVAKAREKMKGFGNRLTIGSNRQVALVLRELGEAEESLRLLKRLHSSSEVCFTKSDRLTKLLERDCLLAEEDIKEQKAQSLDF